MKKLDAKHLVAASGLALAALAFADGSPAFAQHEHNHAPGEKHVEGDEKKSGHGHGSMAYDLGTTTVAGLKLTITQETVIEAGGEGAFDIVTGQGQKTPKAIRAWYGVASGEGSLKTKAEAEPNNHFHSHVEVPKKLQPAMRYWVEVEPASGKKAKTSFEVKTK